MWVLNFFPVLRSELIKSKKKMPVTIDPQIAWYREYVLQPNANVAISFNTDTNTKQAFENSLYKKIWNGKLEGNQNYPNSVPDTADPTSEEPYYTFTYGINEAETGCKKSMLFGITFKHGRKAPEAESGNYTDYEIKAGYLFIVAAYTEEVKNGEGESATTETVQKVRVRSHQLVPVPNTEFSDDTRADITNPIWGIKIADVQDTRGDIVIGIKGNGNSATATYDFYFPLKSFFLEGRHQEPVQFVDDYPGKFAITLLSA